MIGFKSLLLFIGLAHSSLGVKECLINGQCNSDPIEVEEGVTFKTCQQSCIFNNECNWFTHEKMPGICFMYSDCSEVAPSDNVSTNRRDCEIVNCKLFVTLIHHDISLIVLIIVLDVFLVISGHNGEFQKNMPTEFVDVAFPKSSCKSYSYYPYATHGSGIGYLTDTTNPVICGGLGYNDINGYETMASCYKFDLITGEYTFDRYMFDARFYSGPLYTGNGILFTGDQMLHPFFPKYF